MSTYRYFAPCQRQAAAPDAESIMDQLAEHMLEKGSLEQALLTLSRQGVHQRYSDSLDGFDQLASRLRELRRQLQEQYTLEPLLKQLSDLAQSLIHKELEALRREISASEKDLYEKIESFLDRSDNVIRKLEEMRCGKRRTTAQGCAKLEKEFEQLFLDKHELEAQEKALRQEEASRLAVLQQIFGSPGRAFDKLKNYRPHDPSVAEAMKRLAGAADKIASLERAQVQPGLSGTESVGLEDAISLVKRLFDMERLEGRLKKGTLSTVDQSILAELLGPDALVNLDSIVRLKERLASAGYLDTGNEGLKLSPRAIRRIGQKALSDIFSTLARGQIGGHQTHRKGAGQADIAATKTYKFGDSFNIHLSKTLMNALVRDAGRVPLDIVPADFEVFEEQRSAGCSNVLMLDLSYTMAQNGKLQAAKKVIFALDSLIRTRFPRDTLHIVGFATYARELSREELPYVTLTLGNPFTNIQDGLRLAEKLISRYNTRNRQIILITDGEPTAFCRDGDLYVDYPPTPEIFVETMKEVVRITRKGIVINTFMLDSRPGLIEFVERMTRANKGRAFFSSPHNLGQYLLVDYLSHRKRVIN
ncbi:MAG: VWA domain-containing protein [Candidatus Abyssubacteria bacterium]